MGVRTGWRVVAAALAIGIAAAVVLPVQAKAAGEAELAAAKRQPAGSVYLFLGLANIFSTGLDTLGDELRARGVPANVLNYSGWGSVAAQIEARYRTDKRALPVIIVGHSFGGDAVLQMSAELARKGIPVSLAVVFDATAAAPVAANVRHLINYYSPSDGIGKRLSPARGFRGRLENINVDRLHKGIDHFDIEKDPSFHRRVIAEVLAVYGVGSRVGGR
jgi:pimeloyl-ACP methyl ester carboxylesterase